MSSADKWNERYRTVPLDEAAPARVLRENLQLLPTKGRSLDLAAGLGANAWLLAQQGLESHAWDISQVAMHRLEDKAAHHGMTVHCQVRDVVTAPPEPGSFDLIIVSHFLERALCPAISRALTQGGLLFYQTFTVDSTDGPANPAFRLQRNELLSLFPALQVVYYREEGLLGREGCEAMLIATRP